MSTIPNEEAALSIVQFKLGKKALTATRFLTGLDNYVYKVDLEDGTSVVARLNVSGKEAQYEAAVYWYTRLEPAHVPMPKLYFFNTKPGTVPYMIMEYVEGKDLGEEYSNLTSEERKHIASHIATIHQSVAEYLPLGPGFGFADNYSSTNLHTSWITFLHTHLDRSAQWINEVGFVNTNQVERVRQKLNEYQNYFSKVSPTPFLHDTTTKNVLVSGGKVVGIVDIDSVCFGDPLFVPALTKMALLSINESTEYINFWCDALQISEQQNKIVDLYTAMFCANFLGEIGKQFNKELTGPVDSSINQERKRKLDQILDNLIQTI